LHLKDGLCQIVGQDISLQSPVISWQAEKISLSALIPIAPLPIWASVDLIGSSLFLYLGNELKDASLQAAFDIQGNAVDLKKIEGSLYGVDALWQKEEALKPLTGQFVIRPKALLLEKLPFLQLQEALVFQGSLDWQKEAFKESALQGEIAAPSISWCGSPFGKLQGSLKGTWKELALSLQSECAASQLTLDNCRLYRRGGSGSESKSGSGSWQFHLEKLEASQLKPSLFSEESFLYSKNKHLTFEKILLHQFKGRLFERDSWKGKGAFTFEQSAPRSFSLFSLPSGILSRIGFDAQHFHPASGTIFYEVDEEKIYLKKLHQVFSQGKVSEFYLYQEETPSYIDFEGNLHLTLHLKQSNVLFKLGELFTLTVKGNLQKPIVSLKR
jgi:hypothetical protein